MLWKMWNHLLLKKKTKNKEKQAKITLIEKEQTICYKAKAAENFNEYFLNRVL